MDSTTNTTQTVNSGEQQAPTLRSRGTKEKTSLEPVERRELTTQQETFCQYFASPTEFYGNGTQSYAAAYDKKITPYNYEAIRAASAALLIRPDVLRRINELLRMDGFNDANIDKQLLFLITQGADFKSKLGAIKEYNKLKQRITEKLQIEMPVASIRIFPVGPAQLNKEKPKEVPKEDYTEIQDEQHDDGLGD